MGGGDTTIQQPAAPPAPTVTSSIEDYIKNVPGLFQAAQQYQPRFAALQQQISRQTSPITAGFQEDLAQQAQSRMTDPVPEDLQEEYKRNIRAQLGEGVKSPIGAATMAKGLIAQRETRQAEGRQLALALAGRQQIVQPPSQQDILGGFNVGQSLGFNQGVYGTQANIFGTQAGMANQQAALNAQMRGQNISMINSGMGMIGTAIGSSIVLKDDVKPVTGALGKVEKLQGVSFNWKKDKQVDGGVIAEELEQVIPDAVVEIDGYLTHGFILHLLNFIHL